MNRLITFRAYAVVAMLMVYVVLGFCMGWLAHG